jgi:hypothetical protein
MVELVDGWSVDPTGLHTFENGPAAWLFDVLQRFAPHLLLLEVLGPGSDHPRVEQARHRLEGQAGALDCQRLVDLLDRARGQQSFSATDLAELRGFIAAVIHALRDA